ncbi:MAG: methionyl-tRNA formyltransferase [Deltaproteobacteria bacterium]|nr:methionyl-tRNA formyltransferase [Deltaproteobacteria bacterium]
MKIAFLGTPPFAVAALEALAAAGHTLLCVVAQPDRPAGRGQALAAPATKEWALARGLPVLQPEKVRDGKLAAALGALSPDLLVVVAYGRILGKDLLTLAPRGAVNVHASLLPRWRGAAPIQWSIAEGDRTTGVTIMRMDEGLDTGDVLLQRETAIGPHETSGELFPRLARLGGEALCEALPLLEAGRLTPVRQGEAGVTLAPVIEKEQGRLDFRLPAARLACRIRGFSPWPGAFTTLSGKLLKVHAAREATPEELAAARIGRTAGTSVPDMARGALDPGEVAQIPAGILLGCGDGSALLATELQLEGKRRLPAADFAKGIALPPGTRLGGAAGAP